MSSSLDPPSRPAPDARAGLFGVFRRLFSRREPAPAVQPRRLIVGLGNPGPDYEDTRHNAGFMVADRLAEHVGVSFETEIAQALVAHAVVDEVPVALAKPLTFMNRSGQAYLGLLRHYGLEPEDALVVYDDLALPVGAVRLRGKGGAGGHNGVQDIIQRLNSTDFPRMRLGVGDSFASGGQVQYVLSPFADEEWPAFEEAVGAAAEAALTFVREGLVPAMNRHNRRG